MSFKEEIDVFLDVAGTARATIEITEFCETEGTDKLIPTQPLSILKE
jgi:hypothetical protein